MSDTAAAEKPTVLQGEVVDNPWAKPNVPRDQVFDAHGRFKKGNAWAFKPGGPAGPGHPVGLRNRVNADFLTALSEDFERHGVKAIQRMRNAKPHLYVQVLASLLPKQLQIEEKPLDGLGDADLAVILSVARQAIRARRDAGEGEGSADGDEPAPGLPALPEAT